MKRRRERVKSKQTNTNQPINKSTNQPIHQSIKKSNQTNKRLNTRDHPTPSTVHRGVHGVSAPAARVAHRAEIRTRVARTDDRPAHTHIRPCGDGDGCGMDVGWMRDG